MYNIPVRNDNKIDIESTSFDITTISKILNRHQFDIDFVQSFLIGMHIICIIIKNNVLALYVIKIPNILRNIK